MNSIGKTTRCKAQEGTRTMKRVSAALAISVLILAIPGNVAAAQPSLFNDELVTQLIGWFVGSYDSAVKALSLDSGERLPKKTDKDYIILSEGAQDEYNIILSEGAQDEYTTANSLVLSEGLSD